jgi:hypothetical protein
MTAGSLAPAPASIPAPHRGHAPVPAALESLWVRLLRESWSCLAVVAVGPGVEAGGVVDAFATVCAALERPFRTTEALDGGAAEGARVASEIATSVAAGARVVVELRRPLEGAGATAVVAAADAVLLVVRYGASETADVADTVERIGRDRILGCVALGARAG